MAPITPQNLLRHELMGLEAKVVGSPNGSLIGLEGRIMDETKKTLILNVDGKRKTVPKDVAILRLKLPDGRAVEVDGRKLLGRPEDRIKLKVSRW
ncbi:MAG: ribonuclease P protein component 1 [Candidatus Bathyarchaeia archaeon]